MSDQAPPPSVLPDETAVGRVAIRVADLDDVLPFYREVIGCEVERDQAVARLSAPGGRTLLVLSERPGSPPRPPTAAGLFHVAIRVPDRAGLAAALDRVRTGDGQLTGASDHLVSEALYLRDPTGNGIELYRDRPREAWTRTTDGRVEMDTLPLDLDDLATAGGSEDRLPSGTDVGHVHLETTDLDAADAFYVDRLGLRRSSQDYPGARFLAAGGYHHHLGLNRWNRRTDPVGDHQGLRWFELVLPDESARSAALERLADGGAEATDTGGDPVVAAPDGIELRLSVRDEPDRS